jgi:hypothetical protein
MGHGDHDDPGADATKAFRVLHHEEADGVRYADSGVRPDGSLLPMDTLGPEGILGGLYPVPGRYAGYERSADDHQYIEAPQAAGEQPFTRVYARPADPRQASPSGASGGEPGRTQDYGRFPAVGYPEEPAVAGYPGEPSLVGYQGKPPVTLGRRLAGLRLDRWLIAGGSIAAAVAVVAVVAAFATAGGSSAARPATTQTATVHVTQPACTSPRMEGLPAPHNPLASVPGH